MTGKQRIGMVREAYSVWERRAPFTPSHVEKLTKKLGIEVVVQPSKKRIFNDYEYVAAGATLSDDLSGCNAIFGVKKVPMENLIPNKTYLFFSHVIKAQLENMSLLDTILERNIRLIDYECITKGGIRGNPRLVAFGDYAGKAGMIDTFRGLGQQLLHKGISTPFVNVGSAYMYPSYADACKAIRDAGNAYCLARENRIEKGSPYEPLVFMFTGTGNVNQGARNVFQNTPHTLVKAQELVDAIKNPPSPIIGCQVNVEDMVEHIGGSKFNKQEYYQQPNLYKSVFFEKYGRHANVLVNGAYWDARYPRVVSKADLDKYSKEDRRLHFISDISCDRDGGVEILSKTTSVEEPFFNSTHENSKDIMIMGVDILPSELPREASQHFGDYLLPFVPFLADGRATSTLAPELSGACIAESGKLRDGFKYIEKMRFERERANLIETKKPETDEARQLQIEGSAVFRVEGHLFDSGLINKMLDLVEVASDQGRYHIVECLVGSNSKSMILLQITMDQGRAALDKMVAQLKGIMKQSNFSNADAVFEEMPTAFCNGIYDATLKKAKTVRPGFEKDTAAKMDTELKAGAFSLKPSLQTVLVLGSGMVAKPCVEYLSRDSARQVIVASSVQSELDALTRSLPRSNIQPCNVNVGTDKERVSSLIRSCDAVISLLPWQMHTDIAKMCISNKVKLVTASYVSPQMQELNDAAVDAGISITCEMGLDPGMDHLSAMMVIDEIHDAGEKVHSFSSVCGGLPAPEAANNPFGYKFSWSPRGVLSAMQNSAIYYKDGETVRVDGADLLSAAEPFDMHMMPSLAFEVLPNRDSTIYATKYGIPEAKTCFRGTLRYRGFSNIMYEFTKAGFLKENLQFEECLKTFRSQSSSNVAASNAMDWLLDGYDVKTLNNGPAIDNLCNVLQAKLALQPGERDLCAMQHTFNGNQHFSTLLALGDDSSTAMAKTVGMTVAIGAELVLDKSYEVSQATGIVMPTQKHIYAPALELLAQEGLVFHSYH